MRCASLAIGGLVWACACTPARDVTQTIVWVDAEPAVRAAVAQLEIRTVGPGDGAAPAVTTSDPEWPVKLVLAPKHGDASRRFTLHVEAFDTDRDPRAALRLRTGFVASETRYVELLLHAACIEAECDPDGGCDVWSFALEPEELTRDREAPRRVDATCNMAQQQPPPAGTGAAGAAGATPAAGTGGTAGRGGSVAPPPGACRTGYTFDGRGCVDVDECSGASPCGDHGRCQNQPGDYRCDCEPGYRAESGTCVRAVDCATDNGGCEESCDDAAGAVTCGCPDGAWLEADGKTCSSFGAPVRLDGAESTQPMHPHFAFDAEGNGLAVWIESGETGPGSGSNAARLRARAFVAGVGWVDERLEVDGPGSGRPSTPRVAMSSGGRGLVVWTQTEGSDGDIWAVELERGELGEPVRIDQSNVGNAYLATVALDASGQGWGAWLQTDDGGTRVWVNRYTLAEGWETAEALEGGQPGAVAFPSGFGNWNAASGPGSWPGATPGSFGPRVALDAQGNASVAWTEASFTEMAAPRFSPWIARFDAGAGRWRSAVALDDAVAAGVPDSQLHGEGAEVAVWAQVRDGRLAVRARSRPSDGAWREPVTLSTADSALTALVPRVALAPSGWGAAVWPQYEGPSVSVWADRYDPSSDRWLGAVSLSSFESVLVPMPQVAVDPEGRGFGVWSEALASRREIRASRLDANTGFAAPITLATDASPPVTSPVQVAVDPRGRAVAIWDSFEVDRYELWSSRVE